MNTILQLLTVVTVLWLVFGHPGSTSPKSAPDTREQVMARVMLHQARRGRQLAELERAIQEGADRRLSELGDEDWGRPS